jgi:hypothetical protein
MLLVYVTLCRFATPISHLVETGSRAQARRWQERDVEMERGGFEKGQDLSGYRLAQRKQIANISRG